MSHGAVVDAEGRLVSDTGTAIVPRWSFTKTLIAACALRLAEAGRLDLDAPLPGRTATCRAVLQHRAGLPDYGGLQAYHLAVARGDEPWSDAELLARLPPDHLLFAPETSWAYSNIGYLLIRRAIERTCN
jgi:D-alanyl-D-alanine carboxypeptidase